MAPLVFARDLAENMGPVVNIINWFVAFANILFVGTRIGMKSLRSLKLGIDDLIILLSMTMSLGIVVAVTLQTSNGLGRHEASLTAKQLEAYQKSGYSGDIFYILTMTFSKISIILLLSLITPIKVHKKFIYAVGGVIVVWGFTATFVALFQCHVPDVWKTLGDQCINQTGFWLYFGIVNLLLELALVMIPSYVMQDVHMARSAKATIIACFAMRLLVVGSIITELVFRRRIRNSSDLTFDMWTVVVSTLFVQSFSIITASIPYLKPFFANLESGMLRTDDLRRREERTTVAGSKTSKAQFWAGSKKSKQSSSSKSSTLKLAPWQKTATKSANDAITVVVANEDGTTNGGDAESTTSRSRFIHQTTTWEISDAPNPSQV